MLLRQYFLTRADDDHVDALTSIDIAPFSLEMLRSVARYLRPEVPMETAIVALMDARGVLYELRVRASVANANYRFALLAHDATSQCPEPPRCKSGKF